MVKILIEVIFILLLSATSNVFAEEVGISLDFQNADIHNVLKTLSYTSGVNIVADKDVSGTVTINLENVSWQVALDTILETHGYIYQKWDKIIIIQNRQGKNSKELDKNLVK